MTLRLEVDALSPELQGWFLQRFNELKELIVTLSTDVATGLADIKTAEQAEADLLGQVATAVGSVVTDIALLLDKVSNLPTGGATAAELQAFQADITAIKDRQAANATALQAAQAALAQAHASANPAA